MNLEIIKRVAGVCFALSFAMAIVIFTGYGRQIVPISLARQLFLVFGIVAIFLNLISFQKGKHSPLYSLFFWGASIILFAGLVFRIFHWPGAGLLLIAGIIAMGGSFLIPSKRKEELQEDEELLDNF